MCILSIQVGDSEKCEVYGGIIAPNVNNSVAYVLVLVLEEIHVSGLEIPR